MRVLERDSPCLCLLHLQLQQFLDAWIIGHCWKILTLLLLLRLEHARYRGILKNTAAKLLSCFGKYEGVECACLPILARLILVSLAQPELHGLLLCQVKWRWSLFGGFLHSVSWAYSRVILGVRWSLSGCSCQDKETGCQKVTERLDFLWCCFGCISRGNTGKLIPNHSRRTSSTSACSRQSWGV